LDLENAVGATETLVSMAAATTYKQFPSALAASAASGTWLTDFVVPVGPMTSNFPDQAQLITLQIRWRVP
jgi:hypothetical protein